MKESTLHTSHCRNSSKATVVDLLWITLLIGGAAAGFVVGSSQLGIWGGLLGIPLGFAVGLLVCYDIACLLNALVPDGQIPGDKPSNDEARSA
jgi:hypothetical protein